MRRNVYLRWQRFFRMPLLRIEARNLLNIKCRTMMLRFYLVIWTIELTYLMPNAGNILKLETLKNLSNMTNFSKLIGIVLFFRHSKKVLYLSIPPTSTILILQTMILLQKTECLLGVTESSTMPTLTWANFGMEGQKSDFRITALSLVFSKPKSAELMKKQN